MGVGINETSKLVGTAITASVAGRMIGQEKNEALLQGSKAHEENVVDKAAAKDLVDTQIPDAEGAADLANDNYEVMRQAANATFDDPKATPDQRLDAMINEQQALDDKTAAQRALSELKTKLEATQERLVRQEKAMARGRKWGGAY